MKITFTLHAEYRIKKRNVTKEDVIDVIEHPDRMTKKHGVVYSEKDIGRGSIEVVCEKTESNIKVITFY